MSSKAKKFPDFFAYENAPESYANKMKMAQRDI